MSPRELMRRLYQNVVDDAITDSAAQLSYYFLLALFPFLFFLVTLTAYLPLRQSVMTALDRVKNLMPDEAMQLVRTHLDDLLGQTRPKLLTFTLLVAVWAASRGVDAVRTALNRAHGVPETRPYWRTQALALGMTLVGTPLVLLAFSAFALGSRLGQWVASLLGAGIQFQVAWSWLRWPFTLAVMMVGSALLYWVLPSSRTRFRVVTAGSAAASLLWVGSTWAFTQYAEHFGRYNVTYGSIGGVIVLMVWLYLSGLSLIFGGEIDSVLERGPGAQKAQPAPGDAGSRSA
jgi:membrane protein